MLTDARSLTSLERSRHQLALALRRDRPKDRPGKKTTSQCDTALAEGAPQMPSDLGFPRAQPCTESDRARSAWPSKHSGVAGSRAGWRDQNNAKTIAGRREVEG